MLKCINWDLDLNSLIFFHTLDVSLIDGSFVDKLFQGVQQELVSISLSGLVRFELPAELSGNGQFL